MAHGLQPRTAGAFSRIHAPNSVSDNELRVAPWASALLTKLTSGPWRKRRHGPIQRKGSRMSRSAKGIQHNSFMMLGQFGSV
jgi:hypothetical protein